MKLFFRFWLGFVVQILPCAFFSYYFWGRNVFTKRRIGSFCCVFLIVSTVFSAGSVFLVKNCEENTAGDGIQLLFLAVLSVFYLLYLRHIDGNFWVKLYVLLYLTNMAFVITEDVNLYINLHYYGLSDDPYPYYGICIPVLLITAALLLPIVYHILVRYLRPAMRYLETKVWKVLCMHSLSMFFMSVAVMLLSDSLISPGRMAQAASLTLGQVISHYYIFRFINECAAKKEALNREMYIEQTAELREEHYQKIEEGMSALRRNRHDMRHHVLLLKRNLDSGRYEAARRYLEDFELQCGDLTGGEDTEIICEDSVVDTFIRYYRNVCGQHGISFSWKLNLTSVSREADISLTVILGNLLENAVHACLETEPEERYIRLTICQEGGMLVILTDNSMNSTAPEEIRAGIGIRSICHTSEACGGKWLFEASGGEFRASVSLKNPEK